MRTGWSSMARRSRLVSGLALMLLATFSVLAFTPPGSLDGLTAVSSRSECGYLKIFRWRDLDPHMVIPRPSGWGASVVPESSPFPHEVRIDAPVPAPSLTPEPFPGPTSYPPDCHPIPEMVPIAPAAR